MQHPSLERNVEYKEMIPEKDGNEKMIAEEGCDSEAEEAIPISSQIYQSSQSSQTSQSSQSSQSSIPEAEISIWADEIEAQNQKRVNLTEAIDSITDGRYSPLKSTLNTDWNDVSDTQQRYYVRKAKEAISASLSVLAPGQEELVWRAVQAEPIHETFSRKHFDPHTGIVDVLVKAYDEADTWQTKRQILSLFANDFTKSELQEMIPGLSKWRIDQASLHATEVGKGQPPLEKPIYRIRIDPVKVDHFINYISRPEFVQDVAFGTKTLKLDSGERVPIPAVIRTMLPSRIISQYLLHCNEQNFDPPSERSLYRIM